jgi:hypothetical protein
LSSAFVEESFVSRECKNGIHENCHEIWKGLGFHIVCSCDHHKNKRTSELVAEPLADAIVSRSFQEPTQNDHT